MDITSIIGSITLGTLDEHLDALDEAIRARRKIAARSAARNFSPGDQIEVVGRINPKYLVGLTGKIEKVNQTTATITWDNPTAARRYSRGVMMPFEFIRKVG